MTATDAHDDDVRTEPAARTSILEAAENQFAHDLRSAFYPGHRFENVALSDNAQAIFGNVYTTCDDVIRQFTPEQELRSLSNALYYHGMNDRAAQINSATPETCDWIWSTSFAEWVSHPQADKIFWISGKPGSGKSTLMKYLVTNGQTRHRLPVLAEHRNWKIVRFFFDFRAAERLANTKEGMLRSILYQLLQQLHLPKNALMNHDLDPDSILTANDFDKTIVSIARLLKSECMGVLLLIDGLDECGSDISTMIKSIKHIHDNTSVRICLASRPESLIQFHLRDCPEVKVQDYNDVGIKIYVKVSLSDIDSHLSMTTFSLPDFVDELVRRAEGVFLWVRYAVELIVERFIQGCTEDEIRDELSQLPKDTSDMYLRILNRIPEVCKAEVALILFLLNHAPHKITLDLLFASWLMLNRKMNKGRPLPQIKKASMFHIRLQGFLGGLIDVKCRQDNTNKAPTTFASSEHAGDIDDPDTQDSLKSEIFKTYDNFEVSMSHETLRQYLERTKLIEHWAGETLLSALHEDIWTEMHCNLIASADEQLGVALWQPIRAVGEQMHKYGELSKPRANVIEQLVKQSSSSDSGKSLGLAMTLFHLLELINSADIDPTPFPDTVLLVKRLVDAIRYLDQSIATVVLRDKLLDDIHYAIRSPMMLFRDLLEQINIKHQMVMLPAIATTGPDWHLDLSYAAARNWAWYFETDGKNLTDLDCNEKDYIFSCAIVGATAVWPVVDSWALKPFVDRVFHLLFNEEDIQMKHFAIYMRSPYHVDPANIVRPLTPEIEGQHSPISPLVVVGDFDCYVFRKLKDKHLMEIWIDLRGMPELHLRHRLLLLQTLGIDINNWTGSNGENAAHLILDDCKKSDLYRNTVLKLSVLARAGLNFNSRNSQGQTALQRAMTLCQTRREVNTAYWRAYYWTMQLDQSDIVIDPRELEFFEATLGELETRYLQEDEELEWVEDDETEKMETINTSQREEKRKEMLSNMFPSADTAKRIEKNEPSLELPRMDSMSATIENVEDDWIGMEALRDMVQASKSKTPTR